MPVTDSRPTRAQFNAMPVQQRHALITPVDKDGKPFPTMTASELIQARIKLGLSQTDLGKKLGLRRNHGEVVDQWENGNVKKLGRKALVPGPAAAAIKSLLDASAPPAQPKAVIPPVKA